MSRKRTEALAQSTRRYRRLHKWLALPLFLFMFIIGATGVLLGWKKQADFTPPTQRGISDQADNWISLKAIQSIARQYATDSLGLAPDINRIDVRPGKGVAKILFETHYTELQVDLTTGKIVSHEKRWNDFIEHLHDGTIIDRLIGNDGEQSKITYTTLTSFGLMLLSFSGFWMWWNPKRIRKIKGIANR
ncbi:MAG: PepSY-associated TM helix domain-containing protein [Bacteroidota bacterium]